MSENTKFVNCKVKTFTEEKEPDFEREHTKESIFLIHKWVCEGMTPKLIGSILNRSEDNVLKALRIPLCEDQLVRLRQYFSPFKEREFYF